MAGPKGVLTFKTRLTKLFLVSLLLILFISVSVVLRINHIDCMVEDRQDQDFCKQLDFLKGRSYFYTNLEATSLYQQVLTNDLGQVFMPVEVSRQLPDRLIVFFIREDPLYRLTIDDQTYLVNSEHFLAEDSQQFDLAQVLASDVYEKFIYQDKINSEISMRFFQLVDELVRLGVNFDYIYFNQNESYVLANDVKFLFSDQDELKTLAVKIYNILGDFSTVINATGDRSAVSAIDMRFDTPLVISD